MIRGLLSPSPEEEVQRQSLLGRIASGAGRMGQGLQNMANDPRRMAMLGGVGQGLLQAGAMSQRPINMAEAMSMGLQGGQQGVAVFDQQQERLAAQQAAQQAALREGRARTGAMMLDALQSGQLPQVTPEMAQYLSPEEVEILMSGDAGQAMRLGRDMAMGGIGVEKAAEMGLNARKMTPEQITQIQNHRKEVGSVIAESDRVLDAAERFVGQDPNTLNGFTDIALVASALRVFDPNVRANPDSIATASAPSNIMEMVGQFRNVLEGRGTLTAGQRAELIAAVRDGARAQNEIRQRHIDYYQNVVAPELGIDPRLILGAPRKAPEFREISAPAPARSEAPAAPGLRMPRAIQNLMPGQDVQISPEAQNALERYR
jgi:hypothetical protein